MTEDQREALAERAAIIEYEGGLDRKAATLAAFALYFPGDYRAMKEEAATHPDGEAALYEFLEGLIAGPETAREGATVYAETKNAETHGNAPERPSMGRETRRKGFEKMAEYARGRSA